MGRKSALLETDFVDRSKQKLGNLPAYNESKITLAEFVRRLTPQIRVLLKKKWPAAKLATLLLEGEESVGVSHSSLAFQISKINRKPRNPSSGQHRNKGQNQGSVSKNSVAEKSAVVPAIEVKAPLSIESSGFKKRRF